MSKLYNLDLTSQINDLDGNPLAGTPSAGQILANALMNLNRGPALKLFSIATRLHTTGVAVLDEADFQTLFDVVEGMEALTNLSKAQILEAMNAARHAEDMKLACPLTPKSD